MEDVFLPRPIWQTCSPVWAHHGQTPVWAATRVLLVSPRPWLLSRRVATPLLLGLKSLTFSGQNLEPERMPRVRLAQRTRARLSHIHERAQFMTSAIVYSSKRLSRQGLELIFSFLSVHPLGNDESPVQEKLSLDFGPRWNLLLFSFMFSPN